MPRLDELPASSVVFIDANIFLGHFLSQSRSCTTFLERLWNREITGVTSVLALSEVRHGLLRAEVSARHDLASRRTVRYLRDHPAVIATLADTRRSLEELRRWPLRVVHLTRGQFWQACRLSERFGLLTHDALHLATLRAHRLCHLASADRDFLRARIPNLTVWRP